MAQSWIEHRFKNTCCGFTDWNHRKCCHNVSIFTSVSTMGQTHQTLLRIIWTTVYVTAVTAVFKDFNKFSCRWIQTCVNTVNQKSWSRSRPTEFNENLAWVEKKSQCWKKKDLPYCWTLFLKAPSVSRAQAKTTKPDWFGSVAFAPKFVFCLIVCNLGIKK